MSATSYELKDGSRISVESEDPEFGRRILACLQACRGITTQDLEAGIILEMCEAMDEILPLLEVARRKEAALAHAAQPRARAS